MFVMRPVWPQDPTSHPYDYYTTAAGTYHVDYVWHVTDTYVITLFYFIHSIYFLICLNFSNASLALAKTSTGWIAEIQLPYTVLGYQPLAGEYIPFDMEVIASSGEGMRQKKKK
jgi:hypothetical protein